MVPHPQALASNFSYLDILPLKVWFLYHMLMWNSVQAAAVPVLNYLTQLFLSVDARTQLPS